MTHGADEDLRILLVEDDEHDAVAFQRALRRSHRTVVLTRCTRAEEARSILNDRPGDFDILVSDHHLPGQMGLDFLEEMIAAELDMPMVLLTGSGSEEVAVEALKAGVSDYIVKDPESGYLKLLPLVLSEVVAQHRAMRRQQEMEERMRLAAAVIETTAEAIMITDRFGHIEMVNPAFTEVTGYAAEDVVGKTPAMLRSGRHDDEFYADMWCTIEREGHWRGEIWNRRKNGEIYVQRLTISAVRGPDGVISRHVAVFSDITDIKRQQEQVFQQATRDALTGLPNRALMLDRLEQAMAEMRRERSGLAVMFIDLDGFKGVNDTLGHLAGDKLLQEVAERLRGCVRSSDTVARLGGDEFIIIALRDGGGGLENARAVAEKVVAALAEPYAIDGGQVTDVGASVGIVEYGGDPAETVDGLIEKADDAMYEAKRRGKGRYCIHGAGDEGNGGDDCAARG